MAGPGIQHVDLEILSELGHVSVLRGEDASGIAQGRIFQKKVEKVLIDKRPWDFTYYRHFHKYMKEGNKDILSGIYNNFFMGHVRAATKGSLTSENAHPFDTGRYVSMHNGTLRDKKYDSPDKTDSEMMFRDMEQRGIVNVLNSLDKDSAYAVIILDREDGVIRLARNSFRPLFFCFHATREVIYWASEDWMLRGIINRKGEKIRDNSVYFLEKDHLYTINPNDVGLKKLLKIPLKETEKPVEKPRIKVKADTVRVSDKPVDPVEKPAKGDDNKSNIIPWINHHASRGTSPLSSKRLNPTFCCGCSGQLTLLEMYFNKVGHYTYLCDTCQKHTTEQVSNQNVNLLN